MPWTCAVRVISSDAFVVWLYVFWNETGVTLSVVTFKNNVERKSRIMFGALSAWGISPLMTEQKQICFISRQSTFSSHQTYFCSLKLVLVIQKPLSYRRLCQRVKGTNFNASRRDSQRASTAQHIETGDGRLLPSPYLISIRCHRTI
jgi:hypothetical protein